MSLETLENNIIEMFDENTQGRFSIQDLLEKLIDEQCKNYPDLQRARRLTPRTRQVGAQYETLPLLDIRLFKTKSLLESVFSPGPSMDFEKVWRSSGTGGLPSIVPLTSVRAYRRAIDFCLAGTEVEKRLRGVQKVINLVPTPEEWPLSSLAFMFDHILKRLPDNVEVVQGVTSTHKEGPENIVLKEIEEPDVPTAILTTSYMGIKLMSQVEWELPDGSFIVDTGGYKGVTRDYSREEFKEFCFLKLGLAEVDCFSEYGMSELSSMMWSQYIDGEEWWKVPQSMEVEILNPDSHSVGQVGIFDLFNVWTSASILTEDRGEIREFVEGTFFRPHGRLKKSAPKGCSLTAERADR